METHVSHLPSEIELRPGLVLRTVVPKYFDEFTVVVEGDRDHIGKWMPWAVRDLEESRIYYEGAPERKANDEEATYNIFLDGKLVGATGIHKREETKTILELGYWLISSANGQGIMTDCVNALTDLIFRETTAPAIEISCDQANEKSAAVPMRAGYSLDREVQRMIEHTNETGVGKYFQLTRGQWEDRQLTR